MAHKMAHTPQRKSPLSSAPGWARPGSRAPELWARRTTFVTAAEVAVPMIRDDLASIRPLAVEASAALKQVVPNAHLSWLAVQEHIAVVRSLGDAAERFAYLPPAVWPAIEAFHDAMLSWARNYHLVASGPFCVEGPPEVDWILETATINLALPIKATAVPQFTSWSSPLPGIGTVHLPSVEAYRGDVSEATWHQEQKDLLDAALREHLASARAALRANGYTPIPKPQRDHFFGVAARWTVLGEEWADFLHREKLDTKTPHWVRQRILDSLKDVGIVPRAGLKTV